MSKVFQDAKDKYVTAVLVNSDSEAKTLDAKAEDVLDAFLKGVLVVVTADGFVRPALVSDDGTTVDVNGDEYTAAEE